MRKCKKAATSLKRQSQTTLTNAAPDGELAQTHYAQDVSVTVFPCARLIANFVDSAFPTALIAKECLFLLKTVPGVLEVHSKISDAVQ
jgi:hypothetical protein